MTTPLPFYPRDAAQLQAGIGDVSWALISAFERAERIWARAEAARADGSLALPPFNYTPDQVAYVDRLVSDLYSLKRVAYGQMAQQDLYNFLDYPGRETGFR